MKYWRFIAIGLAAVFLAYYYFAVYRDARQQDTANTNQQITTQKQWETKTDERLPVLIKVTPMELGPNQNQWKFTVTFTTHSGDLNQDPAKVISLIDDQGKNYQPIAWEGPEPGGHHIEGAIVFNTINPAPKFIELKIKDVGDIPERSFKWNLQ